MKTLGIVTARAGSKRLPKKNIIPFKKMYYGLPWQALSTLLSSDVDDVVLTTDILELQTAAEKVFAGKVGVINRKPELAQDDTKHVDVIKDVLDKFKGFSHFVLVQPTSPLVSVSDINFCLSLLREKDLPGVFSVNPALKPNGAIYAVKTQDFLEQGTLFPKGAGIYVMPWEKSVDVDEWHDLIVAEAVVYGRVWGFKCK